MADPRQELEDLRRLDELMQKASEAGAATDRAPQKSTLQPGWNYAPDIAMGVAQPILGGAQLATRGLQSIMPAGSSAEQWAGRAGQGVEDLRAMLQRNYEQQTNPEARFGSGVAQTAGEMAGVTPLTNPLIAKFGPAAGSWLARFAQSAGAGGLAGAVTPTLPGSEFLPEKAKQTGQGLAIGGLTAPVSHLLSNIVAPRVSQYVQTLMKEGVTPTVGELMGGMAKRAEEGLISLPVIGDIIKGGMRRSVEQFNKAMYVRALSPLGPEAVKVAKDAPVGNEGIRIVGDQLSNAYESALSRSVPNVVRPPPDAAPEIQAAAANFRASLTTAGNKVPDALRTDFMNSLNEMIFKKITPGGTITPSVAKEIESELGREGSNYLHSALASERKLGMAYKEVQSQVRNLVAANNPTIAPEIRNIDKGWQTLAQLETAGAATGAKEGLFTPAQLSSGIRAGDPSIRHRAFARDELANLDLARAGESVLSGRLPDSGTIMRGLIASTALGTGSSVINPTFGAITAGLVAPYTPGGQQLVANILTKRPELMRAAGRKLRENYPYFSAPITSGLLGQDIYGQ